MPDLEDGETAQVKGSGSSLYTLKNIGGVYSCTCPAWMHQSLPIERRTCKHIRAYRGDDAEKERLGTAELSGRPARAPRAAANGEVGEDEIAREPPILLAHKWETDVDLRGWWMSEKLDGVRAYWDGTQFLSRQGNVFHAPDWFKAGLPDHPLDGELWSGRKKFQRTVGIVRRQDKTDLWKEIRYVVFDAPAHSGPFEDRLDHCKTALERAEWASVHDHDECRDHDHLKEELARVEALGGEGLMLRKPRSKYEIGRSYTLLKVKSFFDAEARVLEHVAGAGKHKGRLGALVVELPDGTRFNVGTGFSDAEREEPPPIGSIITFRYQELSDGGVPRFPSYVSIRHDFTWPSQGVSPPAQRRAPAVGAATSTRAAMATEDKPKDGFASTLVSAVPAPRAKGGVRRLELQDGETRYFWEIEQDGTKHRVRFGTFEAKVKRYGSEEEASAELERRIAEKLGKGFEEV